MTDDRPLIQMSVEIADVRDMALAALANGGLEVYQRDGFLVDVLPEQPPRIRAFGQAHLKAMLTRVATWERWDVKKEEYVPAVPSRDVVAALHELGYWPGLPPLRGIVQAPTLRPDGSILSAPGYDASTGLLFAPSAEYLPVPDKPTVSQVREAMQLLFEVVCDFPFAHDAGPAAWLAALLTTIGRHAIPGPAPMFLFDANVRGSGKTMLADLIHFIVAGAELEKTPQGKNAEEDEKRLLGLALAGVPMVLFDNCDRPFGNAVLDLALTSGVIRARMLGTNDMPRVLIVTTWFATGNNLRLVGDMVRRTLRIRLLSPEQRPEQRETFRHPRLRNWVLGHRPQLVQAALTLWRGYFVAGRPTQRMKLMGSFEEWSELVRGCLLWLDQPDPLDCNTVEHDDSDDEEALLPDLIEGWAELCQQVGGPGFVSTGEAVRRLSVRSDGRWIFPLPRLRDALSEMFGPDLPDARRLGNKLKKYKDRNFGGRCLTTDRSNAAKGWKVQEVAAQESNAH